MTGAIRVCGLFLILAITLAAAPAAAQVSGPPVREGKAGGVLRPVLREDLPQGFAIHESATNSVTWPAMPCYSNLVMYDQTKRLGRMDTIVPELAEKWSWQDNYRNLVFFLRRDVKWHDGQPFTSKDVKFTFDVVREAAEAPARLRINPRKEWYANVDAIEAPDPYTVVFRLKRPQPSLVAMLASGYSPVLPAHVPLAEHRSRCIGTGPFKFKEWKRGQSVELVRNPDYFVKGRPYLDGVRYTVIVERGTRVAALQAGQIDVAYPGETTLSIAEQLKKAVPGMVFTETASNVSENLLLNTRKPPFDNLKVRRALSFAIDRRTYTQTVHRGAAVIGASLAPKPWGVWGLLDRDLSQLPGYGGAAAGRAQAKALLAEAGFANGFDIEFVTYVQPTSWSAAIQNYLQAVGIRPKITQLQVAAAIQKSWRGENPLYHGSWGSYSINDVSAIFPVMYGGGNDDYARDPELTKLVEAGGATADAATRKKVYSAAIKLMTEKAYWLPLFTYVNTYAFAKQLEFKTFPDELPRFYFAKWK